MALLAEPQEQGLSDQDVGGRLIARNRKKHIEFQREVV
jgi:hypothetical protein